MFLHRSVLQTIFVIFCFQQSISSSPLLLWSNENLFQSSIPISGLSAKNLVSNYLCSLTKENVELRLFSVDDLCIEDIQRGEQKEHSILLEAKKPRNNFRFFPNVNQDVYKTFSMIPQSNDLKCSQIHFQISSDQTFSSLGEALNKIEENIQELKTNSEKTVIVALMNKQTVLSRQRRAINGTNNATALYNNQSCMFHVNKLRWSSVRGDIKSERSYKLIVNESDCTIADNGTNSISILKLVWLQENGTETVETMFYTQITTRYWYLQNATLNSSTYRHFAFGMHSRMDTPRDYSYVCTNTSFVHYNDTGKYGTYDFNNRFTLVNFQFQPFGVNGSFGPPNYCTSFFTSGIWMGITSSLLCLGILLFGVHRMMSIKSNDRFDDPKSKPLLIKAQE